MYYIWPLEVHLINYILHVNSEIGEKDMRKLANGQCIILNKTPNTNNIIKKPAAASVIFFFLN